MAMKTGLFVGRISKNIGSFLTQSFQNETLGTLYIKLLSEKKSETLTTAQQIHIQPNVFRQTVMNCYESFQNQNMQIDVRILLTNARDPEWLKVKTSKCIEVVYFDSSFTRSAVDAFVRDHVTNITENCRIVPCPLAIPEGDSIPEKDSEFKYYDNVVLGGSFDKMHIGHKILFSEAVMRCRKRLTVGVTCDEMLKTKVLCELIDNCFTRMKLVEEFLCDVDPEIYYDIVKITDMYGPTKTDPTFQMIVVSSETQKATDKINEYRLNSGLNALDVVVIKLIDDCIQSSYEEPKISSSNYRMRMLGGTLRLPAPRPLLLSKPYIIGLTGGIASGKTSVSCYLKEFGCEIVNCDEVAHQMYAIGSKGYDFIKNTFGLAVLNEDGSVNRKQLGSIVFNNQDKLQELNNGLWPLILERVNEKIRNDFEHTEVVVMEAALLIQANWTDHCHEIWSCIIPPYEAVKRLQERNNLSVEDAQKRLDSQPSNEEYVNNANVIFCTFWSPSFTKKQVERAWLELRKRLLNRPL